VEKTIGRNCWEASDQRRDAKRHLLKWRFARLGRRTLINHYACTQVQAHCATCTDSWEPVLSKLPIRRLKRTTLRGREGSPLTKDIRNVQRPFLTKSEVL